MIDIKIDFDDASIKALASGLSLHALERATKRAVRKTALWTRTHLLRELKDGGIRRKMIVHRVRIYDKQWREGSDGGPAVKIWFGISALNADELGKPIKTARGYRVKSWHFEAAFMPSKNSRYNGKLYQRTSKARLPIKRAKVEVDLMANTAFSRITGLIPGRLQTLMQQELNYELHKLAGRAR
ncbi:MAG: hypothetical protein NT086_11075 [Proteobacteria bacterium]|nr:hypothetical protein [Pseudomonadota bacterium]